MKATKGACSMIKGPCPLVNQKNVLKFSKIAGIAITNAKGLNITNGIKKYAAPFQASPENIANPIDSSELLPKSFSFSFECFNAKYSATKNSV